MKNYQIDCTVVTQRERVGICGVKCYHVGLFIRACNPYNAVVLAHDRLKEDFNKIEAFSVHKVEEVECYDEKSE